MAADDILVKLKALLELDSAQANQDVNNFVNSAQQRLNSLRAHIEIDQSELEQLRRMLNHTREQVTTQFTIPVAVDQRSLDTFREQLNRYRQQIIEAGGRIQRSDLTPVIRTEVLEDGTEQITQAYRAVITFETGIGETTQRIIEFDEATGQINESMGRMSTNFAQQRKQADNLTNSIIKYRQQLDALRGKASAFLGSQISDSDSFKQLVNSISFDGITTNEQLEQMVALLKQAEAQYKALNASITNNKMGDSAQIMSAKLQQIPIELDRIEARFSGLTIPDSIVQRINRVRELLTQINSADTNSTRNSYYNELVSIMNTLGMETQNVVNQQQQYNKELQESQRAQDRLNSLMARYQATATRYSAFKSDSGLLTEYRALGETLKQLQQRMEQVKQTGVWDKSITADIASANSQMSQFNNRVVAAGKNAKSLKDTFREAFSTFGTWLSATSIMMRVIQGFRQAVTAVKDIDAAMTNLKKVTNETNEAYETYLRNVGKQAQQIGSSMSDLIESASTFAKLGYSFKEAQGLAEVATIFANVGDFNNINTATNGLITAMKSFNVAADDAMSIADKINEVANNYAVSADDLTTGLAHAASALNLAGNSIDQTIAMITAMSEITQNASESGNALKILSMRLRGAKAELETAGEDTDGMCESTSKLREKILALTGSVDIMADEAGTKFKSTYQIMQEIAAVWNDLSDINQAALLETIAGKLRGNSISALLTNMAQANNVLETSLNSAGSALQEHERWMESIEAHEKQMKAAWQDFSDSLISTEAVKGWYDALTNILNVLTKIVDTIGSLPTLLGAVAGVISVRKGWLGTATDSAGNVVGRIGNYVGGSGGFSFGKMINGEVDASIINQYTEALNNGATAADAMRQAVTDASGQVIHLNGATRAALATQNGAAAAMQQFGISTTATTAKVVAQTVAVKALNAALHIGIMALVSLIATGISKGVEWLSNTIDKEINKIKYLNQDIESLEQKFNELNNEITSVNDELKTTQDRIDELQGKDNLSFVEKGELEQLRETNRELERRITNLKEQADIVQTEKRKKLDEKFKEEYETSNIAKSEYTKAKESSAYSKKSLMEKIEDFNNMPWEAHTTQTGESYITVDTGSTLTGKEKIKEYIGIYTEINNKKKESAELSEEEEKAYEEARKYLIDQYEYLSTYLDDYGDYGNGYTANIKGMIENIGRTLYPDTFKQGNFEKVIGLDQYKDAIKEIQQLAKDDKLTEDSIAGYSDLMNALANLGFTMDEVIEQFYSMAEAERVAIENATSFSTLNKQFQDILETQSTVAEISKDQGYSSSITEEQYQKLVSAGQEYADCVENINGYLALNIDKVNQLIQAKYEEQKVAVDASKAQAEAKYLENAKEIKVLETALSMLGEGYDDVAATLRNNISSLQLENNGLINEIAGYERLTSQLQYATSAYKKWLDAQNAPEADDAYNNLLTAMEQIKEGQESGRIGTAKYKAAVELLVPDGKDVSKYLKTLEKYLTEDASGLQHFIDEMYKNAFTSKNADGTYSFMEGVTVEDIAKGLGLTDEVTQYMLQGLQAYGWEVNLIDPAFQSAKALETYNDAAARVEEAQKRLDELMADSTSTVEERTAAQEKLNEAQQEKHNAAVAAGLEEEKTAIEKLKDELAELQAAYDTLKEFKLTGDIDPNFETYAANIISVIDTLSTMPEEGYTINVSNGEELGSAIEQANAIQNAITELDTLADSGVISYELAATIKEDTLSPALETIKNSIDEYNEKELEEKSVNLTINPDDQASSKISEIENQPHVATIHLQLDENDKRQVEQDIQDLTSSNGTSEQSEENGSYWFSGQYFDDGEEDVSFAALDATRAAAEQANAAAAEAEAAASQAELSAEKAEEQVTEEPPPDSVIYGGVHGGGPTYADEEAEAETGTHYDRNGTQKSHLPDEANLGIALGAHIIDDIFGSNLLGDYLSNFQSEEDKIRQQQEQIEFKPIDPKDFEPVTDRLEEEATEAVSNGVNNGVSEGLAQNYDDSVWVTPPITLNADTTEAENAVDDLADKTKSAWEELPNDFQKVDAFEQELFSTHDIDQAIANLGTTWDKVRDAYAGIAQDMPWADQGITPTLNEDEFKKQIEEIYGLNYDGPTLGLNADPSKAIATADSAVQEINRKTATITVKGKYAGTSGITLMAKGTRYAKDEDAIVGEAGVETWIHDGQYTTVGHDGAELVHLNRGDQILTAQETKQLFGNKKRKSGNAYASGVLSNLLNTAKTLVAPVATAVSAVITGVKTAISGAGGTSVTGTGTGNTDIDKNKNTSSGGSSKKDTSYLDSLDDLVDWIPKAIENLKKKTDEYISYADKAVGYMLKNKNLDAAIKNISREVDLNLQAYDRYIRQANDIARNLNLSSDIVKKIQDGTIDIRAYDEDTRKAIDAYKKWYELAIDCRDAVEDLKNQQYDLAKQKLDNITQYYENRITLLGTVFDSYQKQIDKKIASGKEVVKEDYSDMISNTENQVELLAAERDALSKELNALVSAGTIQVGSDDWYSYTDKIKEFDNTITDAQISIEEFKDSAKGIVLTNLQTAMSMLEHVHETIQGLMDLRVAQGKTANAGDYRDLIASSVKQIKNLETQNAALREQQMQLDVLSEKYQEIQSQIDENEQAILSAKTQQEEWNDAIIDLEIDKLREQNQQYKNQLELMDAIENLEKAKQRRALIYREGQGFNYEAAADDIRSAQQTLDDLLLEQKIQQIEDSKKDNNLYDDFGNELAPIADTLSGLNLSSYYGSVLNGSENSSLLADVLKNLDIDKLVANGASAKELSVVIESGAINLSGVNDVNTLADAITNQLPNVLLQQLYKD